MTITLNDPEVDRLARKLSDYTGESITQAVLTALRERLEREAEKQHQSALAPTSLKEELLHIGQECAALPLLDERSADEILGYNGAGVAG